MEDYLYYLSDNFMFICERDACGRRRNMANYVKVRICCPCGNLLDTRQSNADSTSTTRGTKHCSACKRDVKWWVCGDQSGAAYK